MHTRMCTPTDQVMREPERYRRLRGRVLREVIQQLERIKLEAGESRTYPTW